MKRNEYGSKKLFGMTSAINCTKMTNTCQEINTYTENINFLFEGQNLAKMTLHRIRKSGCYVSV
jgi:hypothetical protein